MDIQGALAQLAEGHDLTQADTRAVFDEVNDALGEDLFRLMQEGPEDDLRLTRNAQPALFAASMAALAVLQAKTGTSVDAMASFVAGHSLGEYSALAAAGTLAIGDAARLLRLRGDSMQQAVPAGKGAMAAILGAEESVIDEITAEASAGGVIQLANDNAPGQIVVSGAAAAVDLAIEAAKARGIRRAIKLPVSAPFHCDMMQPAADAMAAALADADMKDQRFRVLQCCSGTGEQCRRPSCQSGNPGDRTRPLARDPARGAGRRSDRFCRDRHRQGSVRSGETHARGCRHRQSGRG